MARLRIILFLLFLFSSFALAQTQPQSDPQALSLATQSMATLTGGTSITDATLNGNVSWIAGSDTQTGTGTFLAKGVSESRYDLILNGGNQSDIRNASNGSPAGAWVGSDGVSHSYASQNCWTDSAWFFPALSALSNADLSVVLTYVGPETRLGVSVQHLQAYRFVPAKSSATTALLQQESTTDFYLNAVSLLPVATTFKVHPDDDSSVNLAVEVDYSSYQASNGAQLPMRVQRYLQGELILDLSVTAVSLNSGIPDSDFTIQ